MSTELIGFIFIAICACISLLQGMHCARLAMKEGDKVMAVGAFVFHTCGLILLLCLNSMTA